MYTFQNTATPEKKKNKISTEKQTKWWIEEKKMGNLLKKYALLRINQIKKKSIASKPIILLRPSKIA